MTPEVLEHLLDLEGVAAPLVETTRPTPRLALGREAVVVQKTEKLRSGYVALIEGTTTRAVDKGIAPGAEALGGARAVVERGQVGGERRLVEGELEKRRRGGRPA